MNLSPSPVDSRALVASLNAAALARTLTLHPGILIRAADLPSWRPCAPEYVGTLVGLEHLGTLVPLCTDGCVAWFLRRVTVEGEARNASHTYLESTVMSAVEEYPETSLLFGHVAHFTWLEGEMCGAPPQPYHVEEEKGKPREITPFQSQKTGKWWFVRGDGKWFGPHATEAEAVAAIGAPRAPSSRASKLSLALELLNNVFGKSE